MFFQQPTKYSVLDQAKALPARLQEVRECCKAAIEETNKIPSPLALQNAALDKFFNNSYSRDDAPNYNPIWRASIKAFCTLIEATQNVYELAVTKKELKEAAAVRKAIIKTGNLKDKIDTLLPDNELKNLNQQLIEAYTKLERVVLMMNGASLYNRLDNIGIEFETLAPLHQLLSKNPDIKNSAWLREIMHDCLEKKSGVSECFKTLFKDAEWNYGKRFENAPTPSQENTIRPK